MGTRSITHFYEGETPLCSFYRQFDGYPSGHGADLAKLANMRVVNGYGMHDKAGEVANGPGCLAAQIIAAFKSEIGLGGVYMVPPGTEGMGAEFIYSVIVPDESSSPMPTWGTPIISVHSPDQADALFMGDPLDFLEWAKSQTW